jgi:hypothetical protein
LGFKSTVREILRKLLARYQYDIVPESYVYDWQRGDPAEKPREIFLPENAREVLVPNHPDLLDLKKRYEMTSYPFFDDMVWTEDRVKDEDILFFRGHNAYVFQEGGSNRNIFGYLLAYYFTKSIDAKGLLSTLKEDSAFGPIIYDIDHRQVSRDLIDSILEIYFLENTIGIMSKKDLTILDIGAGYGRLAHRMVAALPNLKQYICTDAIAVSSFIANYYLEFRGIKDKARIIYLDTIEHDLQRGSVDLAVNVHSFSECTLDAIEWWLQLLVEKEVSNLMIVPNSGKDMKTNDYQNFLPLLERYGYYLDVMEPKYKDPVVQKYAMNPDYYHLFKMKS